MSDIDRWADGEGPEPESLRPLLDELRAMAPMTPARRAALIEDFVANLAEMDDALFALDEDEPSPSPSVHVAPVVSVVASSIIEVGPTIRIPVLDPRDSPVPPEPRRVPEPVRVIPPEPPPPPPPPKPVVVKAPAELTETLTKLDPKLLATPVIPFIPEAQAPKRAAPTKLIPVFPPKGHIETSGIGDGQDTLSKVVQAALPFLHAQPELPAMEPERYGSLLAELELNTPAADAIWRRYQVPEIEIRKALHRQWEARMASDPKLKDRVEAAKAFWKARLLGGA